MSWSSSNYLCLSSSSSVTQFSRCKLPCESEGQRGKCQDLNRATNISAYNSLKPPSFKLDKGQRRNDHVLKKPRNISAYYSLKPPPYKFDALEPYMSKRTLEVHWGEHHRGYVESLNKYLGKDDILYGYTLDELIRVTYNNGNPLPEYNVWNHDFFWESMQPGGGNLPILGLLEQIEKDFGSFSNFREEFIETALTLFGSGWVWLVLKRNEKRLAIATTTNAVTPLVWDDIPLLSLDMWEHSYYLDYKNDKARYVNVFMDHLVSWNAALARMARAQSFVNLGEPKIPVA
ncbi:superoxide dismutase [Fe] 3, chloroplastic isoform X2 [Helianthus annuus]|uniref:superoxide dismutase [Fe] 3, chloroplastic isoform X2 n=1 Tax=Helianthus annuus TaxID=4232 RepID=UPI0016532C91|nr:superoxide dismutase [Fe] 3, chloroplastic isoform X2 [Helianthus annuus]